MLASGAAFKKNLALFVYILGSSFTIIFQRFLTFHFGTFTQNFYRCLAGSLFLLLISLIFFRAEYKKILEKKYLWKYLIGLAVVIALGLVFLVEGLSRTSAILGNLFQTLGTFLAIVVTYAVFGDERKVENRLKFSMGILFSMAGATGLVMAERNITVEYSFGIVCLILMALLQPVGGIFTKKISSDIHPVCAGTVVTSFMTIIFFFLCLIREDIGIITQRSALVNLTLFGSGVLGMFVGIVIVFLAVRLFGIVVQQTFILAIPVFTFFLSYLFLKELLNPWQTVMGIILLIGCYLAMKGRGKAIQ